MLDRQPRRSGDRLDPAFVRPARLVEEVALERLHQVALGRQHVDDVAAHPPQAAAASRGQVGEHGAVARVEDADPVTLNLGQHTRVGDEDARCRSLPAFEVHLVRDLSVGPSRCRQLAASQHARLQLDERLDQSQPPPAIRLRIHATSAAGAADESVWGSRGMCRCCPSDDQRAGRYPQLARRPDSSASASEESRMDPQTNRCGGQLSFRRTPSRTRSWWRRGRRLRSPARPSASLRAGSRGARCR